MEKPKKYIGKRIIITDSSHPHIGEEGTVISFESLSLVNKSMYKIEGSYNNFFAEPHQFKVI